MDKTQLYFDSEEEAMDDFIRGPRLSKSTINRLLEERREKELTGEIDEFYEQHTKIILGE